MRDDWPKIGSGFHGGDNSWGPPHKYGRTPHQCDVLKVRGRIAATLAPLIFIGTLAAMFSSALWLIPGGLALLALAWWANPY